jgi:hypothetical protein
MNFLATKEKGPQNTTQEFSVVKPSHKQKSFNHPNPHTAKILWIKHRKFCGEKNPHTKIGSLREVVAQNRSDSLKEGHRSQLKEQSQKPRLTKHHTTKSSRAATTSPQGATPHTSRTSRGAAPQQSSRAAPQQAPHTQAHNRCKKGGRTTTKILQQQMKRGPQQRERIRSP